MKTTTIVHVRIEDAAWLKGYSDMGNAAEALAFLRESLEAPREAAAAEPADEVREQGTGTFEGYDFIPVPDDEPIVIRPAEGSCGCDGEQAPGPWHKFGCARYQR